MTMEKAVASTLEFNLNLPFHKVTCLPSTDEAVLRLLAAVSVHLVAGSETNVHQKSPRDCRSHV